MGSSDYRQFTNHSHSELRKNHNYVKFNQWFVSTLALSLSIIVSFNLLVDPYGIYKTPNFFGINHVKIHQHFNDRLFHAISVIDYKPVTVLLGSSRTKQGLNPEHPALFQVQPVYNLGLNGANIYEILRYFQHTIKNQPNLKQVILGVDFFMFNDLMVNKPGFDEQRLEKTYIIPKDIFNTLFSFYALRISRVTMLASLKESNKDKYYYPKNGFVPIQENMTNITVRDSFKFNITSFLKDFQDYQLSNKYLDYFKKIVSICRQLNIKLTVFISPSHATQWEVIRASGKWKFFEAWKKELVQVTPVWDFSGYNTMTSESIQDVMKNYVDNSHYTPSVGNLVLNRMLGYQTNKVPADFGVFITPENIESHLAKIRADREKWVNNHRDEWELVQKLETELWENQKNK